MTAPGLTWIRGEAGPSTCHSSELMSELPFRAAASAFSLPGVEGEAQKSWGDWWGSGVGMGTSDHLRDVGESTLLRCKAGPGLKEACWPISRGLYTSCPQTPPSGISQPLPCPDPSLQPPALPQEIPVLHAFPSQGPGVCPLPIEPCPRSSPAVVGQPCCLLPYLPAQNLLDLTPLSCCCGVGGSRGWAWGRGRGVFVQEDGVGGA